MAKDQDWRLRAELADPAGVHARLRDGRELESHLEPLVGRDVVLSYDQSTLFAYANTRESIERTRVAIEHQLSAEHSSATLQISHWDDEHAVWHQVEPALDQGSLEREAQRARQSLQAGEARLETRTVAITSGRMVRNWFETTVAEEAREAGVELSIVEHPHLLTTQLAFTLTGPTGKVDAVIASLEERAGQTTRLETAYLAPI
jgi:hypothetical protein